jgi:secreted Zn-dependent insulinase-like peptidase
MYISVVFMGSEKYPDENDFDKFVNTNGGNSNAATDCEKVCIIEKDLVEF